MINLEGWFPTPIWYGELTSKNLLSEVLSIKTKDPGVTFSNQGGWHSTPMAPGDGVFSDVLSDLETLSNEALGTLNSKKKVRIDSFWLNVNIGDDTNNIHTHGGSILSGVYYIEIPKDDQSEISFYRSHRQELHFYDTIEADLPQVTSPHVRYKPKKDMFLIFPSWLEHDVTPSKSKDIRVSLSFNTKTI